MDVENLFDDLDVIEQRHIITGLEKIEAGLIVFLCFYTCFIIADTLMKLILFRKGEK